MTKNAFLSSTSRCPQYNKILTEVKLDESKSIIMIINSSSLENFLLENWGANFLVEE
jgi:hypothetical protein